MDANRWERAQQIFHEATSLSPGEQRAFVTRETGEDRELAAIVLGMLREDAGGDSLLDRSVGDVAHRVLDAERPDDLLPRRCGPYRLRSLLGEGGMGAVYLADRDDLGNVVAIKILRDAWLSPARRARFQAEQRMHAQLTHPSIARLYDASTLPDGTPYFAMEYVEGVPITDFCRTRASAIVDRLRLFREVCDAVQHAHRHAVIHRDLKPSNILVKADGSVRLLDFGIAKQLDALDMGETATRTGLRLMTPAYAAPEQIRGDRVGLHTDVYALGVLLYELLAGRLPFDLSTRTPAEAETLIVSADAERPSSVARRISPPGVTASRTAWADLDVLVLTAMHKDVQRRYGSVEALMRDVDHYLRGEPLEARPDAISYRARKFVARNQRAVSVTAAALVVAISIVTFYTVRLATARNQAVAEAIRSDRIQHFMLNLFEGDREAGPPEKLTALALLERGVQEADNLGNEPRVQADLYHTLGGVFEKVGQFDRADALLKLALDRRSTLFGSDSQPVAETLRATALLRIDQSKLEEAETLAREALEITRRRASTDRSALTSGLTVLGQVLQERGAHDQAIAVLDEAVRTHGDRGGDTAELASALYELANTHFYAGHYDRSKELNERLLDIYRRMHGDRHPTVSDTLINLGAVEFQIGRYAEAEKLYRQGLEITEAWFGPESYKTAANLTMLGRSLVFQNRHQEAAGILQRALAVRERVYGPASAPVASTVNELASIALALKRYDEAEQGFRRMVDIYRVVHGEEHYLMGIARSNLASVFVAREDYRAAEAIYRDVIALYSRTLDANNQNIGIGRIKLGRALLRQRRYAEAVVETRAGYDLLVKQMDPKVSWLVNARKDMVEAYDALKRRAEADRFRAEQAALK